VALLVAVAWGVGCKKTQKGPASSPSSAASSRGPSAKGEEKTKPKGLGRLLLIRIRQGSEELGLVEVQLHQHVVGQEIKVTTPKGKPFTLKRETVLRNYSLEMPLAQFEERFTNGDYTIALESSSGQAPKPDPKQDTKADHPGSAVVTVSGKFPAWPTPKAPLPGATGVSRIPELKWESHESAETFALSIEEKASGKEVLQKDLKQGRTSYQLTEAEALAPETSYLLFLDAEYTKHRRESLLALEFKTGK